MAAVVDPADAVIDAIVAAESRGNRVEALRLAAAALDQGIDEPLVLLLAAEGMEQQGRAADALRLIETAAEMAPEAAEIWRRLGGTRIRLGRSADGLAALQTALDIDPDCVPALIDAGSASYGLGRLSVAEGYFRRASALAPDAAEPLAALAAIAARRGNLHAARALAERALAIRPGIVTAELAVGRADLAEGLPERTLALMSHILGRPHLTEADRIAALDLRAEAFDAFGRAAEAFADYGARNAILRGISAPRIARAGGERRVDQARRIARHLLAASPTPWRVAANKDAIGARTAAGHVFLLGFPRSGTTLLERSLGRHPGVAALQEVDHLNRAGGHWLESDWALDALASVTPQEADTAREIYWREARATAGGDLAGKVLLDKMPLHTVALPLIAKLFPDARILFAVRDPRDVVLSCFRRRFQVNSAMFEFLNLDDAASYYDSVMALARICRGLLPLAVHEVWHEALVTDFEAELRRILAFVGLAWDPAVTRFTEHLGADPRTPSDLQLGRGLNADGIGQWRRYADQIRPVMPILEAWAAHFGYAPATASGSSIKPLSARAV